MFPEKAAVPASCCKQDLFPGDVLRVGYEDEPWHVSLKISRPVSEGTRFHLTSGGKTASAERVSGISDRPPGAGTDFKYIGSLRHNCPRRPICRLPDFRQSFPKNRLARTKTVEQRVYRIAPEIWQCP